MAAHQLAFEWLGGSAIPRGLFVLHLCDNRRCCRPDHLYAGTQQRNVRDTYERGRMPLERIGSRGERNGSARLTESAVAEMRRLYAHEGCTQASLAKAFGCSAATVHYVVRGTYWKAVAA
jgi:DNA-binding XRE family transcriptional regulator